MDRGWIGAFLGWLEVIGFAPCLLLVVSKEFVVLKRALALFALLGRQLVDCAQRQRFALPESPRALASFSASRHVDL